MIFYTKKLLIMEFLKNKLSNWIYLSMALVMLNPIFGFSQIVKLSPKSMSNLPDSTQKEAERLISSVTVGRTYHFWVEIEVDAALIYEKLTTVEGLNSWLTDEAEVMMFVGSPQKYIWNFGSDKVIGEASLNSMSPPYVFEIQWSKWIDPGNHLGKFKKGNPYILPFTMRYECRPKGNGVTVLHILTYGIKGDAAYDNFFKASKLGWIRSLANLKSVCENGKDLRNVLCRAGTKK